MRKYLISFLYQSSVGHFGIITSEIDIDIKIKKSEIIKSVENKVRLSLAEKYNAEIAEKTQIDLIAISEL